MVVIYVYSMKRQVTSRSFSTFLHDNDNNNRQSVDCCLLLLLLLLLRTRRAMVLISQLLLQMFYQLIIRTDLIFLHDCKKISEHPFHKHCSMYFKHMLIVFHWLSMWNTKHIACCFIFTSISIVSVVKLELPSPCYYYHVIIIMLLLLIE